MELKIITSKKYNDDNSHPTKLIIWVTGPYSDLTHRNWHSASMMAGIWDFCNI